MSLEELSFVAEIVGVVLVLVSLIYLAVQVQQNTKQLKTGSVSNAVHEFIHAFISAHADEESSKIFRNGLNNFAGLTTDEKAVFQSKMASNAGGFHQVLMLYRNGLLPEEEFTAMEQTFLAVILSPGADLWWQQFKYLPPKEFVAFVDKRMTEEKGNIRPVIEALDCFKAV